MKLSKYPSAPLFLLFVFCSIFVQMGLFVHFQRWLSFSFEGSAFWWRSMLLQVAIFAPSIFMMPAASYFAGRFHKGRVMAWSSVGMLASVIAIVVCYVAGAEWVAYGLLGLYGIFLAVLSPAKLGIMKEMVESEDLVKVNSWYMALSVLGTAAAAFFAMGLSGRPDSPVSIDLTLWIYLGLSVVTTIAGFCIKVGETHDNLKMRSPMRNFSATWSHPIIRLSILGLAAFWGVTQIFLILIQNMTDMLNTAVIPVSMFIVTIGYVIGAFSASKASKGFVETGLIPFAAAASAITMFALPFVHNAWLQAILYGIIGWSAGCAFVILRTVIQSYTRPDTAGRIHAVANMHPDGVPRAHHGRPDAAPDLYANYARLLLHDSRGNPRAVLYHEPQEEPDGPPARIAPLRVRLRVPLPRQGDGRAEHSRNGSGPSRGSALQLYRLGGPPDCISQAAPHRKQPQHIRRLVPALVLPRELPD